MSNVSKIDKLLSAYRTIWEFWNDSNENFIDKLIDVETTIDATSLIGLSFERRINHFLIYDEFLNWNKEIFEKLLAKSRGDLIAASK